MTTHPALTQYPISLFLDDGSAETIRPHALHSPWIEGFTTNPTWLRKASLGGRSYREYAQMLMALAPDKPFSFEVIADDLAGIERQARAIAQWGTNAVPKVPVVTSNGTFCGPAIAKLVDSGFTINVTAILAPSQFYDVVGLLPRNGPLMYMSVFCGRIADTARDPLVIMSAMQGSIPPWANVRTIWASPRQVRDIALASKAGANIITITTDVLTKLHLFGKDLAEFSRETSAMFYKDAQLAGLTIEEPPANE